MDVEYPLEIRGVDDKNPGPPLVVRILDLYGWLRTLVFHHHHAPIPGPYPDLGQRPRSADFVQLFICRRMRHNRILTQRCQRRSSRSLRRHSVVLT